MSGPVTAVAFGDTAPVEAFGFILKVMTGGDRTWRYIDCSKVETTDFGMLLLTPSHPDFAAMGIYVHPSDVAWMLRAIDDKKLGFLAG